MSWGGDDDIRREAEEMWSRWSPVTVRHSTMWPGRCGCGRKTMMVSGDIPAESHGKAYECGECYDTRRTLKKLDGLVNG